MSELGGRASSMTDAFLRTGLTARETWYRYLALGGTADEVWVEGQLQGLIELPPGEFNVLAHALNEELDDLPAEQRGPKVAYQRLQAPEQQRRS